MTRRTVALAAAVAFVGTVYLANWLVQHVGPIRVWPTTLLAPAGVYMIGLAFLLRDTVQRFSGQPARARSHRRRHGPIGAGVAHVGVGVRGGVRGFRTGRPRRVLDQRRQHRRAGT